MKVFRLWRKVFYLFMTCIFFCLRSPTWLARISTTLICSSTGWACEIQRRTRSPPSSRSTTHTWCPASERSFPELTWKELLSWTTHFYLDLILLVIFNLLLWRAFIGRGTVTFNGITLNVIRLLFLNICIGCFYQTITLIMLSLLLEWSRMWSQKVITWKESRFILSDSFLGIIFDTLFPTGTRF